MLYSCTSLLFVGERLDDMTVLREQKRFGEKKTCRELGTTLAQRFYTRTAGVTGRPHLRKSAFSANMISRVGCMCKPRVINLYKPVHTN